MKKFYVIRRAAIVLIAALTMNVTANAQEKGDLAVGGNLAVGLGDQLTNFGLGAKVQYNVIKPVRLEGAFTYFLPKKQGVDGIAESSVSMWDLSLNGHYLIPVGEKLTLYPLAGVGLLGTKASVDLDFGEFGDFGGSASSSDFGFNLGAGIDLKLSSKIFLNLEAKYKLSGTWNRFIASAGVAYRF